MRGLETNGGRRSLGLLLGPLLGREGFLMLARDDHPSCRTEAAEASESVIGVTPVPRTCSPTEVTRVN